MSNEPLFAVFRTEAFCKIIRVQQAGLLASPDFFAKLIALENSTASVRQADSSQIECRIEDMRKHQAILNSAVQHATNAFVADTLVNKANQVGRHLYTKEQTKIAETISARPILANSSDTLTETLKMIQSSSGMSVSCNVAPSALVSAGLVSRLGSTSVGGTFSGLQASSPKLNRSRSAGFIPDHHDDLIDASAVYSRLSLRGVNVDNEVVDSLCRKVYIWMVYLIQGMIELEEIRWEVGRECEASEYVECEDFGRKKPKLDTSDTEFFLLWNVK